MKWKSHIAILRMYVAYRLLDKNGVDHSGNREYAGEYLDDRNVAAVAVKALNEMEVQE